MAHEVKNPLAVILAGTEFVARQMDGVNGRVGVVLQDIRDAVRRADRVIRGLLDFSSLRELEMEHDSLNHAIEQALALVKHEFDKAHVTVMNTLDPHVPDLRMDRQKIEQVFVNIFMNAIYAMPQGGTVTVHTSTRRLTSISAWVGRRKSDRFRVGETVVMAEVRDTGTGIPEEKLPKVFDPFFTTKPVGQGTGLGLAVSKKIVELHDGVIDVRNRPEGGVMVSVMFHGTGGPPHAGGRAVTLEPTARRGSTHGHTTTEAGLDCGR